MKSAIGCLTIFKVVMGISALLSFVGVSVAVIVYHLSLFSFWPIVLIGMGLMFLGLSMTKLTVIVTVKPKI